MIKLWQKNENQGFNNLYIEKITTAKICLVSVHGVTHYRSNGSEKVADLNTKGLVITLAEALNFSYFCYTQKNPLNNPYTQERPPVKEFLKRLPKDTIVIDIHGTQDNLLFEYALGTHIKPPFKEQQDFFNLFKNYHPKSLLNVEQYSAKSERSVTAMALKLGLNAIQIEINYALRDLNSPKAEETINNFYNFLLAYEQRIK